MKWHKLYLRKMTEEEKEFYQGDYDEIWDGELPNLYSIFAIICSPFFYLSSNYFIVRELYYCFFKIVVYF